MLKSLNNHLNFLFSINLNSRNYNSFFRIFYLTFFLIPQILITVIKNFKKILKSDSFYAESLRLHYLRAYNLAFGKDLYLSEIGFIRKEHFIYQSFLAIKICYQFIGRPLFILIGHIIFMMYLFNVFFIEEALILIIIFLSSSVFYFNQIERGNYQFLGLILSLIAAHYYFESGLNIEFLLLYLSSIIFSISSFVVLSLVIGINLLINNSLYDLFFVSFCGCLLLILFLSTNFIFLKSKNKHYDLKFLFLSIHKLFILIGLMQNKNKNKNKNKNISRKKSLFRGLISVLPFLFAAVIDERILSNTYFILTIIIFLNQSKILRIFDYYFIYTWSFCFFLLSFQGGGWSEIVALIIIGTNPIYVYAMDNYNFNSDRGFKINSPIFITKIERNKILNKLSRILPKESLVIIPLNKTTKDYNDLWRVESLILEWIWTASENKKIKFFPDWFSIFYVSNLRYNFNNIEKLSKITNSKTLSFKKIVKNKTNKEIQMYKIKQIFRNELLERYCPKIQKYFLLIR